MKSAVWGEARSRALQGTERPEATTSSTGRCSGSCSRLKSPGLALYSLGIPRSFGRLDLNPARPSICCPTCFGKVDRRYVKRGDVESAPVISAPASTDRPDRSTTRPGPAAIPRGPDRGRDARPRPAARSRRPSHVLRSRPLGRGHGGRPRVPGPGRSSVAPLTLRATSLPVFRGRGLRLLWRQPGDLADGRRAANLDHRRDPDVQTQIYPRVDDEATRRRSSWSTPAPRRSSRRRRTGRSTARTSRSTAAPGRPRP
jgi:hypothetical protein